jgi:hypothetical protein
LVRLAESSFLAYIDLKITKKHKRSHHVKEKDQTTSREREGEELEKSLNPPEVLWVK